MRDHYYDHKKKKYSYLSGGCAIIITTGEKKVQVICLAGAQSLLRLEKKKIQSSVWRVCDHYYDQKKKVLVVCLAGARSLLRPEKKVLVICLAGARSLLRPEKKDTVVCLAGCAVVSVFGSGGK